MANIFDGSGLTLDPVGIESVNEIIFEGLITDPKIASVFNIATGIRGGKQIVIVGKFTGTAGRTKPDCDATPNTGQISSSQKYWAPKYITDDFVECYGPLQSMFWNMFLKPGINKPDISGTEYEKLIQEKLKQYINPEMMFRLALLSDTAMIAGTNNAVSAGELPYFTDVDGLFKQMFNVVAVDANRRTEILLNAQATYATQAFDATDTTNKLAHSIYEDMIRKAKMKLRAHGKTNVVINSTQSLVDQYARELKVASGIEIAYTRVENGIDTFKYDGYTVQALPIVDELLSKYYDDGTSLLLGPHIAWMTPKQNAVIGTESVNGFEEMSSEWVSHLKKWYSSFGFMLDVKLMVDDEFQIAY